MCCTVLYVHCTAVQTLINVSNNKNGIGKKKKEINKNGAARAGCWLVAAVVDHLRSSANNDVITRARWRWGRCVETIYHFAARHSSRAQLIIGTEEEVLE